LTNRATLSQMNTPFDREAREILIADIAATEQHLQNLAAQHREVEATLALLKQQLQELDGAQSRGPTSETGERFSPQEKLKIFRGLFRGREDVFPVLWISAKTGRKGYSPACSNEWVKGVCEKPTVKCMDCLRQAFIPVTDQTILDHLQGRHVMGVYPLLRDETCWFLAVDFDKEHWREDVLAFTETCRSANLPFAVERSRSGNGAHVWFFFSTPVLAAVARKIGSFLITETMSRRHELGMASYDRLFPNQDTLPSGGFGNLIALPLQHQPRQEGNTLFLDDDLEPIADQWAFLSSLPRISPATVELLVHQAEDQGQVIGVSRANTDDGEETSPWLRPPSRRHKPLVLTEQMTRDVQAVLSQRLFVEKKGLPSPVLNQIKRLAAFQNPEFYKKQNLRLSTALTPRIISCAEDHADHVSLPRGCRDDLESLLASLNSSLQVEDLRTNGEPIEVTFQGQLTEIQQQAAENILDHDIGVLVAPPGIGKTVLGIYLIAARRCNTLVLVHRQPLLEQWRAQLALFLEGDPKSIGQIGAGKRKITGEIDVAMIQSLTKKEGVDDLVAEYGQVIVDECHHLPAVSYERVLTEIKGRYVVGLTATLQRRDGHHPIVHMQLGPVRYRIDAKGLAKERPFEHRLVIRETGFMLPSSESDLSIQEIYALLAADDARNDRIVDDVLLAMEEGRSPIVLTERKDHLERLHARLDKFVRHIIVLKGGRFAKERRILQEKLESIPVTEERLILATGRYIGEGFDDARLDTLFLALPVSWKGTLVQYAGRLHRLHPGKTEVRIIDYVDSQIPVLSRMFEKRRRGYRSMGYAVPVLQETQGH